MSDPAPLREPLPSADGTPAPTQLDLVPLENIWEPPRLCLVRPGPSGRTRPLLSASDFSTAEDRPFFWGQLGRFPPEGSLAGAPPTLTGLPVSFSPSV